MHVGLCSNLLPVLLRVLQRKPDMCHPQLSKHYGEPGLVASLAWKVVHVRIVLSYAWLVFLANHGQPGS